MLERADSQSVESLIMKTPSLIARTSRKNGKNQGSHVKSYPANSLHGKDYRVFPSLKIQGPTQNNTENTGPDPK